MRVKPYAIRFPSRNARHTALSAPGGWMSTSGCSCRYRSSLRTCSGGPGGTSCTGQYGYPVSGQRKAFQNHLPPALVAVAMSAFRPHGRAGAHDKPRYSTFASGAVARQHPYTTGLLATAERWSDCPGRRLDAGLTTLIPK